MGASAFLKSVDFRAFAVNVKTIAPKKYLYQSGHAIWCERSVNQLTVSLLLDYREKLDQSRNRTGENNGKKEDKMGTAGSGSDSGTLDERCAAGGGYGDRCGRIQKHGAGLQYGAEISDSGGREL